ncbi:MAG: MarR family transcriptional regulator [Azoarcus sp.]|jgi:DNA-binding transcriptional regulator GbsR (MarR family)|nr:MarR family transcriptional regulator [Azoarcus sp.]
MELTPITKQFILHCGEMGSRWGVNRSVAQIQALLYLIGRPLPADEIAETLSIARSNVSTSLKELLTWRMVRVSHTMGDRRDHFEASGNVWELFKLIVEGRKQREVEPMIALLNGLLASPDISNETPQTQQRIENTLEFVQTLTVWIEEMLRQDSETLMKLLKMGAKVRNFLRGNNE